MERNEIVLCKDNYNTEKEFKEAIANQLQLLFDNNYEVLVSREDGFAVIMEFTHDHRSDDWGTDRFMLVTADEEADILYDREKETDASEEEENENV